MLNLESPFFRNNCGGDGQEGWVAIGVRDAADDRDGAEGERMKPSALDYNVFLLEVISSVRGEGLSTCNC